LRLISPGSYCIFHFWRWYDFIGKMAMSFTFVQF
jgi:hypothetical protein